MENVIKSSQCHKTNILNAIGNCMVGDLIMRNVRGNVKLESLIRGLKSPEVFVVLKLKYSINNVEMRRYR
ncbi:hypothetical protein NQ318_018366 [Aromia moschata]|uniref:Uncharacterized protein n=1 Tax=Aromia moschata TaxID=1265417 RepID=A0AAV8ZDE6_9CUCU|nr:hypothetical protein NQ318_018366 [Aromia moschata]